MGLTFRTERREPDASTEGRQALEIDVGGRIEMTKDKRREVEAALNNLATRLKEASAAADAVSVAAENSGAHEYEPGLAASARRIADVLDGQATDSIYTGLGKLFDVWRSAKVMADRELAGEREVIEYSACACGVTDWRPVEIDRPQKGCGLRLRLQCRACNDERHQYFVSRESIIGFGLEKLLGDESGVIDLPNERLEVELHWRKCRMGAGHAEYLWRAASSSGEIKERACPSCRLDPAHDEALRIEAARADLTAPFCRLCSWAEAEREEVGGLCVECEIKLDEDQGAAIDENAANDICVRAAAAVGIKQDPSEECSRCQQVAPWSTWNPCPSCNGERIVCPTCDVCQACDEQVVPKPALDVVVAATVEKPCLKCLVGEAKGRGRYCVECGEEPHCPNCGAFYADISERNPNGHAGSGLCKSCFENCSVALQPPRA